MLSIDSALPTALTRSSYAFSLLHPLHNHQPCISKLNPHPTDNFRLPLPSPSFNFVQATISAMVLLYLRVCTYDFSIIWIYFDQLASSTQLAERCFDQLLSFILLQKLVASHFVICFILPLASYVFIRSMFTFWFWLLTVFVAVVFYLSLDCSRRLHRFSISQLQAHTRAKVEAVRFHSGYAFCSPKKDSESSLESVSVFFKYFGKVLRIVLEYTFVCIAANLIKRKDHTFIQILFKRFVSESFSKWQTTEQFVEQFWFCHIN